MIPVKRLGVGHESDMWGGWGLSMGFLCSGSEMDNVGHIFLPWSWKYTRLEKDGKLGRKDPSWKQYRAWRVKPWTPTFRLTGREMGPSNPATSPCPILMASVTLVVTNGSKPWTSRWLQWMGLWRTVILILSIYIWETKDQRSKWLAKVTRQACNRVESKTSLLNPTLHPPITADMTLPWNVTLWLTLPFLCSP